MTINGSMALRCVGAALALAVVTAPAIAFNPDPPRDPRSVGLIRIDAIELGEPIVRMDRWPNGTIRRCVHSARLSTPSEGGPS
ncbi:MAG: hypothetical protein NBV67_16290, partial [Tagaea sp.]|nr:hypothetical protein [Tagaea sp.]